MARPASKEPTDVELEILKVLWSRGALELGGICTALRESREVATTTVATMLKIMLEKGLVKRSKGKRGYRWSPRADREATVGGMVRGLLDRVFEGSAQHLVAHMLEGGELGPQDRDALRRMLDEAPADPASDQSHSKRDGGQG